MVFIVPSSHTKPFTAGRHGDCIQQCFSAKSFRKITSYPSRPRPSGLGEIDGLHGTSTQSCILTYDLCTGEPLRRPKPAQDEWYVIMSGHPFIKALAAYWGGASVQGLRCHFISMQGKSPMKLEVTSRHDYSCLLGRKASKQTNKQNILPMTECIQQCFSAKSFRKITV